MSVASSPTLEVVMWVVELNFVGWRIRRWAERRRHLLAPDPRSFVPRELPLPSSGAA
jgi:hypothetical protein